MKEKLETLLHEAVSELAPIATEEAFHELRVKYLGRKGALTAVSTSRLL